MLPLVILSGPTAAGKTKLSLALADAIGGEIISADSMQVYRGMDIGTAKIPLDERRGIPHHLIDCLNPEDEFNVAVFVTMAKKAISGIYERGHIPIVVGGTGFYIQALLKDLSFEDEPRDDGYRELLERKAENGQSAELHAELCSIDPVSGTEIPPENVKRVIRALEYYHYHGEPISLHNERQKQVLSPYHYAYFVLTRERDSLYQGINDRVDIMFSDGLVAEVRKLNDAGYHIGQVSMQGLGYRQLLKYFAGEYTLDEAKEAIKLETRHFAKRQLTWFRREPDVVWFQKEEYESEELILAEMLAILKAKAIV